MKVMHFKQLKSCAESNRMLSLRESQNMIGGLGTIYLTIS